MMFNLSRADSIFSVWLPFMIAGIVLVFVSGFASPKRPVPGIEETGDFRRVNCRSHVSLQEPGYHFVIKVTFLTEKLSFPENTR